MRSINLVAALSLIFAAIYLVFAVSVGRRQTASRVKHTLIFYAVISAAWEFLWAVNLLDWLGIFDEQDNGKWVILFGIVALALVFLVCTLLFLRKDFQNWVWIGMLGGITAIIFLLILSFFPVFMDLQFLVFTLLLFCWISCVTVAGIFTRRTLQQAKKSQYRNRMVYWGISILVITIGDLILLTVFMQIFFSPAQEGFILLAWILGSLMHLVGFFMASYVGLIHNVMDLMRGALRVLNYVVVTVVGVSIYLFVLGIDLTWLPFLASQRAEWIFKASILVILVTPALVRLFHYTGQLLFDTGLDRKTVVREYGLKISNLVEMHDLARVALDTLDKTLDAEFSLLMLVDDLPQERCYHLQPVLHPEKQALESWQPGRIQYDSAVTTYFLKEHSALTQYDLDFLPRFTDISNLERKWLGNFQADIFVPILTINAWIGMFILGSKKSGDRFFDDDIELLMTIADQTVAALQNARLFSDLRRLNENLSRASQDLEEANQKLRELDEMKSAFISVVTHEMRTPLANMGFSMQVIEMYGMQKMLPEQVTQLQQISAGIKASRAMVDNLVTLAALLNNQADMYLEKFDFQEILTSITPPFQERSKEKNITLRVDRVGDTFLVGDRKLLGLALRHLMDNAVKFTNPGGSIWVSCWMTTDALWLDVRDTGKGIPLEKLEKVWQTFSQIGTDPVRRGVEGLGLGLSLVKLIVSVHGGQVFVESEVGVGSVFGFRVPIKGPSYPLEGTPTDPARQELSTGSSV
jgi:signal transduction histidine kinase